MDAKDYRFLLRLYADIVRGFSKTSLADGQDVFIRHSGLLEQSALEEVYERFFLSAVERGVPTEEGRLKILAANKEWSPSDDKSIGEMREFLEGLEKSKRAAYLKRDVDHYNKQIQEERVKLEKKVAERLAAIGTTAESFARKKMSDHNIYLSLFKDGNFQYSYFNVSDYEEMDVNDFFKLEKVYYQTMKFFIEFNLKRISIAPFFQNVFHLAENHADKFFGVPVVKLTFYQSDLFSYGTIFKRILDEHRNNLSPEIAENPDKILDWFSSSSNLKKVVDRHGGKGKTLVFGAKSSELREVGLDAPETGSLTALDEGRSVGIEELAIRKG